MDQIEKIIDEIKRDLNNCTDEQRLKTALTNHPTRMQILGVKVPDTRAIVKKHTPEIKALSEKKVIELANSLIDTGVFECQQVAYLLFDEIRPLLKILKTQDVLKLRMNQDNWVSVDTYSCFISGPAWRLGIIDDELIEEWIKSENVWTRRTAVVSTIALNQKSRGGKGDIERTLKVCGMIVSDKTDLIAKAQSWALRVLSQVDKNSVENYLIEFDDVLPARVKKETWNKIKTGRKF